MDQQQELIAKEEPICLDDVRDRIMGAQIPLSELSAPLIGWALVALLLVDMLGNIIGLPILTGSLIGGGQSGHAGAAVFAFVMQLIGLAVAGFLLYRSRWRIWLPTMFMSDGQADSCSSPEGLADRRFQSLFSKVADGGRRLREQTRRQLAEQDVGESSQRRLIRIIVLILGLIASAALVIWLWQAAVMVLLICMAAFAFWNDAIAAAHLFWAKIRLSYGSMMGLYLGVGSAAVFSLLIGAQKGLYLTYPVQTWYKGEFFAFRVLQLFVLCGLVLLVAAQRKVSPRYCVYYRAKRAAGKQEKTFQVFDFTKVSAWPVFLSLDPDELVKVVVLARREDGHYEIFDHSQRLPLMTRAFMILNLQALQNAIGEDCTEVEDSGDFFCCRARFAVQARSFEALHSALMDRLGNVLPDRPVGVFRDDLFKSERPRVLLDRMLRQLMDDYVADGQATARDLREEYRAVLNAAQEAAMLSPDQLATPPDLAAGNIAGLKLTMIGYEQLRTLRTTLNERIEAPRQKWHTYRTRRLQAKQQLPALFTTRLREHFVKSIRAGSSVQETDELLKETVDCLLQCSGIELEVESFDFAQGASRECEDMVETLSTEFDRKFSRIEEQIKEREARLLEFCEKRVELIEGGRKEVILGLIHAAPQAAPFLLQSPAGEEFIRFLSKLGAAAIQDKLASLKDLDPNNEKLIVAKVREQMGDASHHAEQAKSKEDPSF